MNNIPVNNPIMPNYFRKYIALNFDNGSLSLYEQVREAIEKLNELGEISNDLYKRWNDVFTWIHTDGLIGVVEKILQTWLDNGMLDEMLIRIIGMIGDFSSFREFDKLLIDKMSNEFHERGVNLKWYIGDEKDECNPNNINVKKAFEMALATGTKRIIVVEDYVLDGNITIPQGVVLEFAQGSLKIARNTTLTIYGNLEADDVTIFKGDGTVSLLYSTTPYNLCWFEGTSINKKYDFARRSFNTEFRLKTIRIPKAPKGDPATYDDGTGRLYWKVDGEILINDFVNATNFYIEGEFIAWGNVETFILVKGANKPENVYFYGTLQINVLTTLPHTLRYGIRVVEGARIVFYDQIVINGAETGIYLGGLGQISPASIWCNNVQISFYKDNAILCDGRVQFASGFSIEKLSITSALIQGTDAIVITGTVRDFNIGSLAFSFESKDGFIGYAAENLIHLINKANTTIKIGTIKNIFDGYCNTIFRTSGVNRDNTSDVTISNIYQKYGGKAFHIDSATNIKIENIQNNFLHINSVLSATSFRCKINDTSGTRIDDLGTSNLINGMGHQTRGADIPTIVNGWSIGNIVRETSNGNIFLCINNTGVASNDFVKLN